MAHYKSDKSACNYLFSGRTYSAGITQYKTNSLLTNNAIVVQSKVEGVRLKSYATKVEVAGDPNPKYC